MTIIEFSTFALLSLVISITTLTNILHMQLNEYLLYRYLAFISEKGFFRAVFPIRLQFPAKTIRNLLVISIVFVLTFLYLYLIILHFDLGSIHLKVIFSLLAFVLAKDFVVIGVLLTTPLSWLYRQRFSVIAKREMKRSSVKIIGITGSYGKSSVKQYLHRLLSTKYSTGKTRGNRNTEVGIAMEMAYQLTPSLKYFIAEMGAYRIGDINKLCKQYPPTIGIVTGIGNQHLSIFGSQENILQTKLEMVNGSMGKVYINGDWEGAKAVVDSLKKEVGEKVITYGISDWVDIKGILVSKTNGKTVFKLEYGGKSEVYEIHLNGFHCIINLLPAIVIAREEGIEYGLIKDEVKKLTPILGRLSKHTFEDGFEIINDSYNSNLDGFLRAIEVVFERSNGGKTATYISSLGVFELGNQRRDSYEQIVESLTNRKLSLLTTDPLFAEFDSEYVKLFESESDILRYIKGVRKKDGHTILLLEGRHSPTFTKSLGITKAY